MKVLSALIVLLACIAAATAVTSQWGARKSGDSLMYRDRLVVNAKSRDLYFPASGFRVKEITSIRAVDNAKNGKGATASVTSGGPGYAFSNLRFNSQKSDGINFNVEYYGFN